MKINNCSVCGKKPNVIRSVSPILGDYVQINCPGSHRNVSTIGFKKAVEQWNEINPEGQGETKESSDD